MRPTDVINFASVLDMASRALSLRNLKLTAHSAVRNNASGENIVQRDVCKRLRELHLIMLVLQKASHFQ